MISIGIQQKEKVVSERKDWKFVCCSKKYPLFLRIIQYYQVLALVIKCHLVIFESTVDPYSTTYCTVDPYSANCLKTAVDPYSLVYIGSTVDPYSTSYCTVDPYSAGHISIIIESGPRK